ncbi:MAG: metal ABC transporter ATP-binding protein [Euryarchaeota archaeon]|nr:metal ABC transporter ATP-binding protein [Euryarchaeota archaeon]
MPDDEPIVSIRGVSVDQDDHRVLEDIDLDIGRGEFVGIVGPNGGGKTTLIKALLGFLPYTDGRMRLFGTAPNRFHDWPRVAYVPQHVVHVDPRFPATVREIALLGRAGRRGLFRPYRQEDRQAVDDALHEVGVHGLARRRIGSLSGGERQRVFLAKAIAGEPELLILDEPTTGVDPESRGRFYALLDHLNHSHDMTILLISHDTQAIALSTHRLVALNRTIVYDGDPHAFEEEGGYGAAYDLGLHDHRHIGGWGD